MGAFGLYLEQASLFEVGNDSMVIYMMRLYDQFDRENRSDQYQADSAGG